MHNDEFDRSCSSPSNIKLIKLIKVKDKEMRAYGKRTWKQIWKRKLTGEVGYREKDRILSSKPECVTLKYTSRFVQCSILLPVNVVINIRVP